MSQSFNTVIDNTAEGLTGSVYVPDYADLSTEETYAELLKHTKKTTLYQQVALRIQTDQRTMLLTDRYEQAKERLAFLSGPEGPATNDFAAELRETLALRSEIYQKLIHRIKQLIEPALRPYATHILRYLEDK